MANANITLIGSEDMPSPSEDWLDSWDKYGLMNWHVFYQCYRMFPGRDNQHNPLNNDLAIACVKDMVKDTVIIPVSLHGSELMKCW